MGGRGAARHRQGQGSAPCSRVAEGRREKQSCRKGPLAPAHVEPALALALWVAQHAVIPHRNAPACKHHTRQVPQRNRSSGRAAGRETV